MELLRNGRPRVVITGMGTVTPLGSLQSFWNNLKNGRSGIRRLENTNTDDVAVKIGGEVRDFDPTQYINAKEARRMGRASHFAIAASKMAVEDAGYTPEGMAEEGERTATIIGTTMGCYEISAESVYKFKSTGNKRANPTAIINSLPNMPAHYVSKLMGAVGPLITPSVACATGVQALGEASDLIKFGRIDMAIAGGLEAMIQDYILAGFDAMRAMTTEYNDAPEKASRPFDANRSGFVLGEGCAVFIVESLAHALQRGARIYAEILGYGTSSDAYHVAAQNPEGEGAARAMRWALEDAHVNTEDIDYINAHGTSTPMNDVVETLAIKKVFGETAYNIPVSSTKSMIGHAMAACGAIELAACTMSLHDKTLHPTINYETPDPDCDLDYVPNEARQVPNLKRVMSNSFGLGGQNASMVLQAI